MPRSASILLVALFAALAFAQEVAPPRTPAQVMSYHGADWLERADRDAEQQPEKVIAIMGLKPGDVVADVGGGSGYFARRMAKAVAPEGKVYGQDIQPEMLEILKEKAAQENILNIEPVLGTETDPKLPESSLDWVLLVDVYHEFQQPEPMLEGLKKALKPEGRVALIEYRLIGETAKHIRAEHRMSVKQVLAEWEPAGFELCELHEFLPTQHIFIFRKKV